MKAYEEQGSVGQRCLPLLPVLARLDGRAFHSFCRGLKKPYDEHLHFLMVDVTRFLVDEAAALVGYTQSDEISLLWYSEDPKSQIFFDGRVGKMVSILAALASVEFARLLPSRIPDKALFARRPPVFDCRVWQVPTKEEAVNAFLWRERDAVRNSILAAGQAHFSHKALQGATPKEVQEMLFQQHGVNWNDYPDWARRGTWARRIAVRRPFTAAELKDLPPKHEAHQNPALIVERHEVWSQWFRLGSISNQVAVLFDGASPIDASEA